jgi:lysophospholipase L1-like esterase
MARVRGATALLVLLLMTSGCASVSAAATRSPRIPGTLQVAAVGDSITEADSDDFDNGDIGASSWATYADGDGVHVIGGWAHAGATTQDMLGGVLEAAASGATWDRPDRLVLMGGSNDVDAGVPIPAILANLSKIATIVRADRVTLSAIPPEAAVQHTVDQVNAQLPGLAQREGWQFVDPLVDVRAADGSWLPGMSSDGVHPTQQAAKLIGARLNAALRS